MKKSNHKFILIIGIFMLIVSVRLNAQRPANLILLDSVFDYVCEKKIQHSNIVMRQIILETGWLKSKFLMSKNNIFGFRYKKYLSFNSWRDCVDYYKKWQDKHYKDPNEDYYKFLLRIKYAVSNYPKNLKKINFNKSCNQ
jgi:hypothetical protein